MSSPVATVVVPTHDHGPTALYAVRSVLRQTVEDLEVFVVCDGVPHRHAAVIDELRSLDARVRCFEFPKGPRHGELHRHEALSQASSEYVVYQADDDLWFPDHVETLLRLLETSDLAHTAAAICEPDGSWAIPTADVAIPFYRRLYLESGDRPRLAPPEEQPVIPLPHLPLSSWGHRLDAYRRLDGWHTAPEGLYTDLHMWRQFMRDPSCRLASGGWLTALNFASADEKRGAASDEQRCAELERWEAVVTDERRTRLFREEAANRIERESAWREAHIVHLRGLLDEAAAG